jgi:hypothetical protein
MEQIKTRSVDPQTRTTLRMTFSIVPLSNLAIAIHWCLAVVFALCLGGEPSHLYSRNHIVELLPQFYLPPDLQTSVAHVVDDQQYNECDRPRFDRCSLDQNQF